MSILERILRIFLGGRSKKCFLSELFQNERDVEKGIVLKETGFPYGGVTTYAWWKSNGSGFSRVTHKDFGEPDSNDDSSTVTQCTGERIDDLFSLIEEYEDLKNYLRNVRDGVVYVVSWGTKDHSQVLTIKTPLADSRHYELVTRLKESAMN